MTITDTNTSANADLRGRVVAAAMQFLDRMGHCVLEMPLASTAGGVDVITEHEGVLRFIDIRHVDDSTEFRAEGPSAGDRQRFVRTATAYVAKTPTAETVVSYDVLTAIVFGDRALIEYHHGAHCQQ